MDKNSPGQNDRKKAYKLDRGFRGVKAGAAIGMLLGGFACLLLSRWIPEAFFGPIVLTTAAVFAVFGLFFPLELAHHEFDDDPENITPADRVERLHSKTGETGQSGTR